MKKIIIIALSLLVIVIFLIWRFGPFSQKPTGPVSLTYWSFEDERLINPILAEYKKINPKVSVTYIKQSQINYRTRLQTQIREGVGPDVFKIHNSWLPMFDGDLAPAPGTLVSLDEYKSSFYPVASESFIKDNKIYALPLEIDGLALYINEDILAGIGVNPPVSWQEFIDEAVKMTVKDSSGQIQTAGASLGNTLNIDYSSDILGLLLLQQPSVNLENPNSSATAEVVKFYTGFVTDPSKKTWDVTLPSSTQMFTTGKLAFYFAPSSKVAEIRAANPSLRFKVVPVPQLPGKNVAWASFWGEAVSIRSQGSKEAWEFVKFLSSKEALRYNFVTAYNLGFIGRPYSRVDMATELSLDPLLGAYVNQGPFYKFWYLSSGTGDNGLNDEMIKVWADGINATLQGIDPLIALQTLANAQKLVLDKYTKPIVPTR